MKGEMRVHGLAGALEMLKQLPPEVAGKRGGPARAALRKGAAVLVKESKARFAAAVAMAGKTGITDTTGFTERQIVASRKAPPGGQKGERFVVTVRYKQVHPGGGQFRKRHIYANDIAFIMENGSAHQPATPWLKPAFASKAPEAIRTVESELPREISRLADRLAKAKG